MKWVRHAFHFVESAFDDFAGLGKTVQTIALIVADDTGEGVLEPPEEPDDRFDDMTLISKIFPLFS